MRAWVLAAMVTCLPGPDLVVAQWQESGASVQVETQADAEIVWSAITESLAQRRYWEALETLRGIETSGVEASRLDLEMSRAQAALGDFDSALIHLRRYVQRLGPSFAFAPDTQLLELEDRRRRARGERLQLEGKLDVALGLVARDPLAAHSQLLQLAERQGTLPPKSVDRLVRGLLFLGFPHEGALIAHRDRLLRSTVEGKDRAQKREREVQIYQARLGTLDQQVPFEGGIFELGTTRKAWKKAGKKKLEQDERPDHSVQLSAFSLGAHEVTVLAYRRCQVEGVCRTESVEVPYSDPFQPIRGVSWSQARDVCLWMGGRLPTEAQWEAAARGEQRRRFPWGDGSPTCSEAQHRGCAVRVDKKVFEGAPAPVGVLTAGTTPEGITDLAGNVAEWVSDGYGDYASRKHTPVDPTFPSEDGRRVVRGGSFNSPATSLRAARREARKADSGYGDVGVRCAY